MNLFTVLSKLQSKKQAGNSALFSIGMIVVAVSVASFGVDMSYFYTKQNQMRIAADSAAQVAVNQMYKSTAGTWAEREDEAIEAATEFIESNSPYTIAEEDIEFGFISPSTRTYDAATFSTASALTAYTDTGGFNAVRVTLAAGDGETNEKMPGLFSRYFGVEGLSGQAVSTAIYTSGISSVSGARPFLMCDVAYNYLTTVAPGNEEDVRVRLHNGYIEFYYGGTNTIVNNPCGSSGFGMGVGNFSSSCGVGLTTCSGGAAGESTINNWITNGASQTVYMGHTYQMSPGSSLSNSNRTALNSILNGTVMATLYSQETGSGANKGALVNGAAAFEVTGYQITGANDLRYLEVYYKQDYVCGSSCSINGTTAATNSSIAKIVFTH